MKTFLLPISAVFLLNYSNIYAQDTSPGGVFGERLWINTTISNNQVGYTDKSIFNNNITVFSHNNYPKINYLNFNPAIEFNSSPKSNDQIKITTDFNLGNATIIGVYQSSHKNLDKNILKIKNNDSEILTISTDKIKKHNEEQDLDYGNHIGHDLIENQASEDFIKPRILTYYRLNQPSYNIWGTAKSFRNLVLSDKSNNSDLLKFGGLVPEIIMYNRNLTPEERLRVESYLAVKYGVHLDSYYTRSDDIVIWSKENNISFHYRVSGIGRDQLSNFIQEKSTSSYENPQKGFLTIGRTLYMNDENKECSDCIKYNIINGFKVRLVGNNIEKENHTKDWKDVGGLLDIPINNNDYISFKFKPNIKTAAFIGFSSKEINRSWTTADFGIKKESNNKLSWCKKGECSEINTDYTDQEINLKIENNLVNLYIDNVLIQSESTTPLPLLVDFSLKENGASIQNFQVHKIEKGREFEDKEFYLWGDNDLPLSINQESGISGLTTLNRVWKIQKSKDSNGNIPLFTKVDFNYSDIATVFPQSKDYEYFLVIDKTGKGEFNDINNIRLHPIKIIPTGDNSNRLWAFETEWDTDHSNIDAFTLGYSSGFLATIKKENPICHQEKGKVKIDLLSGKEYTPIQYELFSGRNNVLKSGSITNSNTTTVLENISSGNYTLKLINSIGQISQQSISISAPFPITINLPDAVNITHTGSISLDASKGQTENLIYEWKGPNGFTHNGPIANITATGNYTVTAKISELCSISKEVDVKKTNIQNFVVYPVPINIGDFLTIKANLFSPEKASLKIYDMNGLLVYSKNRNVLSTEHIFNLSLPRLGVYKGVFITASSREEFGIIVNP